MPNNWTLTEQAAIILKSYGVDDVEAARAVVALVLGEAAKVADGYGSVACDVDMRDAIRALGVQS